MQINDTWEIEDAVSGLRLKVIPGTRQDRLHVESLTGGTAADDHPKMNRDFWFTKDGTFDGTGSVVEDMPNVRVQARPTAVRCRCVASGRVCIAAACGS